MPSATSRRLWSVFNIAVMFSLWGIANAQDKLTCFLTDLQGSTTAATDQSGNITWREDYAPYGERLTHSVSGGANHNWYISKSVDVDTNLSYLGARAYDPVVGRFHGVDPLGVSPEDPIGTFNRYSYARNDPMGHLDPNGKEWIGADYLNQQQRLADATFSKMTRGEKTAFGMAFFAPIAVAAVIFTPELLGAAPALNGMAITAAEVAGAEALGGASLVSAGGAVAYQTAKVAAAELKALKTASAAGKSVLATPKVASIKLPNIVNDFIQGNNKSWANW